MRKLLNFATNTFNEIDRINSPEIKSFEVQRSQLVSQESVAFERFKLRKFSSGITLTSFEALLPEVEAAGNDYIDSIFPPHESEFMKSEVEFAFNEMRQYQFSIERCLSRINRADDEIASIKSKIQPLINNFIEKSKCLGELEDSINSSAD